MSRHFEKLRYSLRESLRASTNPAVQAVNPDSIALTVMALNIQQRFAEGYFGEKAVRDATAQGAELKRKDPEGYARALETFSPHYRDIRAMGWSNVRLAETLVSSNLVYAVGLLRDAELVDNRPTFQTSLYDLTVRRTRDDLTPIRTREGVQMADRLLAVRAENTEHINTSYTTQGSDYTMMNFERGEALTWELLLNDRFDEYGDVVYELGQMAARTRAWVISDAIRRMANFIRPPDGANGPTMDNIEYALSYMSQQSVNGGTVSRNLTDIFIPGTWRGTASRAVNTAPIVVLGGATDPVTRINPTNLAAGVTPHIEEILSEIPVTQAGQSNLDWFAADPSKKPVEFSVLSMFAAGPRILTKLPNIVELDTMGSFGAHIIETKVTDVCAASVRDKTSVLVVSGTAPAPLNP